MSDPKDLVEQANAEGTRVWNHWEGDKEYQIAQEAAQKLAEDENNDAAMAGIIANPERDQTADPALAAQSAAETVPPATVGGPTEETELAPARTHGLGRREASPSRRDEAHTRNAERKAEPKKSDKK